MRKNYKIILYVSLVFLSLSSFKAVFAQYDASEQKKNFYIDQNYDALQRDKLSAVLLSMVPNAYFYIDEQWWQSLSDAQRVKSKEFIDSLGKEFVSKIYPTLISTYGLERRPGIDDDVRITVLIHPMRVGAGGYFKFSDEYLKSQLSDSNEREMIYLNADFLNTKYIFSFLAHEFSHLIQYNQKEYIRGVSEDVWLNEARADYAPTLCGYDLEYEGSNLSRRINDFLKDSSDSLVEWQNIPSDYGVINIFTQYLVDHYGVKILIDSLHSTKVGINSLDYALKANGYKEDFAQVFANWTITVLLNNCNAGIKYCYLNDNLESIRILPQINVFPSGEKSILTIAGASKNWSGKWYKIIGINGPLKLKLKFEGDKKISFKVPYIIKKSDDSYSVNFLQLDSSQNGEASISDFGAGNGALFILPIAVDGGPDASDESFYYFSWSVSQIENIREEESDAVQQLLNKIAYLKAQIAAILAQINLDSRQVENSQCEKLIGNLYIGIKNSADVRCLQVFLKSQGREIYPEGLVTGNFGMLTQKAVRRFQEKYATDILLPLGLSHGTGYVGESTRAKINKILNGS